MDGDLEAGRLGGQDRDHKRDEGRPVGRADGGGAEHASEAHPFPRQLVDVRGVDDRLPVAADVGRQVFGNDPRELFADAATAMFDQLTDRDALKGADALALSITGEDWPDLMVNWLRELLYLWNGKGMLIKTATISSISENSLQAKITFDGYNPESHVINGEIKAVTYHQIQVSRKSTGWESKIIFDV